MYLWKAYIFFLFNFANTQTITIHYIYNSLQVTVMESIFLSELLHDIKLFISFA